MHIDLDAFFVSCELLRHPELSDKPIAVGSHMRRGVISTASYVARKYGVHSAMPLYQAKKMCHDLIILQGDYSYYQEQSVKFFSYIKNNVTSSVEMASIDEAFVDLSLVLQEEKDVFSYLKKLQSDLKKETGLSCSIGIGTTKFIAKMASDFKKPMGITIIRNKDLHKMIFPLPIKDLYGVGKKSQVKLMNLGIKTIGDFYNYDKFTLKRIMGKTYDVLISWLDGKGDDNVITLRADPKSISSSSTFMYDTSSYDEIFDSLKYQVKDVLKQLREKNMLAHTVHITLRYSDFKTITRSKTFDEPLKDEQDILRIVLDLFEKNWNGNQLRLVGVGLSNLISVDNYYVQLNLFNIEKNQKECATKLLINELNRKSEKEVFMTLNEYKRRKNGK